MEQLNKIELRGNVGFVRLNTYQGKQVAHISLATNVAYKDLNGIAVIETMWHNVVAWEGNKIGSLDKIKTGSKLYVSGRMRQQRYTGQDGEERLSYEVLAKELELIEIDEPLACGV